MKRNELTEIEKLQIGDRFYFLGDKQKEVHEVISHETKYNEVLSTNVKKDFSKHTLPVDKGKKVVFLRSK